MDVPRVIAGRFRVEREIGKGGMGTVYLALHLGLERPVAVKIIKPEFASDPDVTERFMREARTMARLRHPHAAMIFDAGNLPDGRHFIVMEFVEGETLSETLAREGRFSPERAVRIASDICDVLGEAHQLGIIHRDLKPSNIMLNERGVCVLDFGVAKVLASTTDITSTHATTGSGFIVGTPRYMSPEQCLGQRVGARSDLYSLGVLVYEMLTGQPPFTDALPSAVLVRQATAAPPPILKLREDLPRPLALAVHTLLAKRPEDRPTTASAARSLLERTLVRPTREVTEEQPFAGTMANLNSHRSVGFRAITPLAIIAALGIFLFVWNGSGQTAPETSMLLDATSEDSYNDPSADARPLQLNAATVNGVYNPKHASTPTNATTNTQIFHPIAPTLEEARRAVSAFSSDPVSDLRVVQAGRESAIVALQDERNAGTSHLLVIERNDKHYSIVSRAMLDKPDFRGATWTAEKLDVNGDGTEEMLYTGTDARNAEPTTTRFVLYVPSTREIYAMRLEPVGHGSNTAHRITFSPNIVTRKALPYRAALQQLAQEQIGKMKAKG
jgi:serine/threonine protein kinase